jgi:hypothetical protein
MKASSLCLCLSLSLVCFSAAQVIAQAQSSETTTYRSGLKSIAIFPPTSDLNEVGSDYRVLLEPMVPDTNRLIAAYLLAGDATNLRAGSPKGLSRYALVETMRRAEFAEVDAASFKEISATVAKQFGANQDSQATDLKKQQDELNHKLNAVGAANEVTLDKPVQLGAFFSKPDAYCFGMIAPISGGGSSVKMVSGVTFLRVQNRLVYAYVYASYTGDDSVQWVRNTSEQWADTILKANQ